jgi:hypothetical protein
MGPFILICSEGIRRNKTPYSDVSFDRFSGSFLALPRLDIPADTMMDVPIDSS